MNYLHMFIGVPGSGKTTYAKILEEKLGYVIISSDMVRVNNPKWHEEKVFPEVYRLCGMHLSQGKNVILDATNIDIATRKTHIVEIKKHCCNYDMIAYYFDVPLNVCEKRVAARNLDHRELYLPVDVCGLYAHKVVAPTEEEGFKKIIIIND